MKSTNNKFTPGTLHCPDSVLCGICRNDNTCEGTPCEDFQKMCEKDHACGNEDNYCKWRHK